MTASVGLRAAESRESRGCTTPATRRGPCYAAETPGTPEGNPRLVACGSVARPHMSTVAPTGRSAPRSFPAATLTPCPLPPGGSMFNSPDEVAAYIRDNDVEYVDVRYCNL